MKTSVHGSLAVAVLCACLAACGGGGGVGGDGGQSSTSTALPASVAIHSDARVEAGSAQTFATDLTVTTGLTFRWDFGDGSTGTGATVSHAYATPGIYPVALAVANGTSQTRSANTTIEVGAYANVAGLPCSKADSSGWCWQHAIATGHRINDVFFVDATHVWAVGNGLTILKSADGGTTWTPVTLDPALSAASLVSVRFYDALHGMVLDNQGGGLQTQDGGATWTFTKFGHPSGDHVPLKFAEYSARRILLQTANDPDAGGAMSIDGGSTWTFVAVQGGNSMVQTTSSDCWVTHSRYLWKAPSCGAASNTVLSFFDAPEFDGVVPFAFTSDLQGFAINAGYRDDPASSSGTSFYTQGFETSDGGATWTPFSPTGLAQDIIPLYALFHMTDTQSGWLYDPSRLILYATANAGHDWTHVASSAALAQTATYPAATGFAGSTLWQSLRNRLALSTDGGQDWQDVIVHPEDGVNAQAAASVAQYTDANDFVVGFGGCVGSVCPGQRLYGTSDGGQTFRRLLGPDARDAESGYAAGEFSDFHHGRFLTANGALLTTADGGQTWTRSDDPDASHSPVALHFTSPTEGWRLLGGKLGHTTDGGATWSGAPALPAMTALQGMSWGDATHAWVWNSGLLFFSADAGATWQQAAPPNGMSVQYAVMTGPLTGIASSGTDNVAITQDGGASWQMGGGSGWFGQLARAWGQTVWSLDYQNLQRSKDGGSTWQSMNLPLQGLVTSLSFVDALHGWLVSSYGEVLRTVDGGDTWTSQPVGTDLTLEAVVAVDTRTAWIITLDGQILATATAGQ